MLGELRLPLAVVLFHPCLLLLLLDHVFLGVGLRLGSLLVTGLKLVLEQVHGTRVCTQPCPTVCNPMDCSPPGSSAPGISQARIWERVVISFSRGSSQSRDGTCVFYIGRQFFTTELPGKPPLVAKILLK